MKNKNCMSTSLMTLGITSFLGALGGAGLLSDCYGANLANVPLLLDTTSPTENLTTTHTNQTNWVDDICQAGDGKALPISTVAAVVVSVGALVGSKYTYRYDAKNESRLCHNVGEICDAISKHHSENPTYYLPF